MCFFSIGNRKNCGWPSSVKTVAEERLSCCFLLKITNKAGPWLCKSKAVSHFKSSQKPSIVFTIFIWTIVLTYFGVARCHKNKGKFPTKGSVVYFLFWRIELFLVCVVLKDVLFLSVNYVASSPDYLLLLLSIIFGHFRIEITTSSAMFLFTCLHTTSDITCVGRVYTVNFKYTMPFLYPFYGLNFVNSQIFVNICDCFSCNMG